MISPSYLRKAAETIASVTGTPIEKIIAELRSEFRRIEPRVSLSHAEFQIVIYELASMLKAGDVGAMAQLEPAAMVQRAERLVYVAGSFALPWRMVLSVYSQLIKEPEKERA